MKDVHGGEIKKNEDEGTVTCVRKVQGFDRLVMVPSSLFKLPCTKTV